MDRHAIATGEIEGIKRAAEIMRANAADEFERSFCGRVIAELNRQLVALQKELAAPAKAPAPPGEPLPCPLNEQGAMPCYKREGAQAAIEAGKQGRVCVGCEWKVSTLDGGRP